MQHVWSYCVTWRLVFQFVGLEALATSISDMNPSFFHVGHRRKFLLLGISIVCFFIGLSMVTEVRSDYNVTSLISRQTFFFSCGKRQSQQLTEVPFHTQGGIYIFQVFDYYACSGMTLLLFALLQSVGVGWIYGELLNKQDVHAFFLL